MPRPVYPIVTERLRLRPFTEHDLDALHAIQSREDVAKYLYWAPRTLEESREALNKRIGCDTLTAEGDALALAVDIDDGNGRPKMIGDIVLWWVSEQHRLAEIGYLLHPDHSGRGLTTEAMKSLLHLGFQHFQLHRIIAKCDARNAASARIMEKLGMRREAHFRQNEFVKGEWTDEYVYAILAEEWTARQ